jgi:hypothetical protein
LDFAPDGEISSFDEDEIADAALWKGDPGKFVKALNNAGFVDSEKGKNTIHDWDDYAGRLIEQREITREKARERNKRYRERKRDASRDVAATSRDAATVPNRTQPNRTRPASLGQVDQTDSKHDAGVDQSGFDQFWAAYPKKAKKADAQKAWGQVRASKLTETIMNALAGFKVSAEWIREEGRYIPHPATWLRGRRWEDASELIRPNYDEEF